MLSMGIVGLPNVGKSTLFQALTNKQVNISNYPFTTIEPNVGLVAVTDERLDNLARLFGSVKSVPAAIEFIDIAGLIKGAASGEGLGNQFLARIRETNAIVHLVRVFEDKNVAHPHAQIDPAEDIAVVNTELALADWQTVEKRMEENARKIKTNDPRFVFEQNLMIKLAAHLKKGGTVSDWPFSTKEQEMLKELNLLTAKKTIFAFNISEEQMQNRWCPSPELLTSIGHAFWITLNTRLELLFSEIPPEERPLYLKEAGLKKSALDELISLSYRLLGLITFFTVKGTEAHAWSVPENTPVLQAAGRIHRDFEEKFIKAEVINCRQLLEAGSWSEARKTGLLKLARKDYLIQDGDVIEIKI